MNLSLSSGTTYMLLGSIILIGLVLYLCIIFILKRVLPKKGGFSIDITPVVKDFSIPILFVIFSFCVKVLSLILPGEYLLYPAVKSIINFSVTASLAFLFIRIVQIIKDKLATRFEVDVRDNLKARKIHTQLRVMEKIIIILILVIAFSSFLMTFEKIKQFGISILASAGVIGIVIGFAAQKSIATIFAGLQIALTQPIRIDDVVIVEDEWGWIEEINLTFVVVKIWDQRRLVVPITYFIDKPFQNWTRETAELLGTVFIYTDYTAPIGEVRQELKRIVKSSFLWDKRVCVLQVTNATDKTIELRALVSSKDSPEAWELRCIVREKLIEFLQKNYPECLPRTRLEIKNNLG